MMKQVYYWETITVILIFIYQFANRDPSQKLLGVDKMILFIAFGAYSMILTVVEFFYIRMKLARKSLVVEGFEDPFYMWFLVGVYALGGLLIFYNKSINSNIYFLNILFGTTFLVKSILVYLFYRKWKQTREMPEEQH